MVNEHALDRTARLIALDIFDGQVDLSTIIEGLLATTARIQADAENLASWNGQVVVATLFMQLSMMGVAVHLDIPAVPLAAPCPPLVGVELGGALIDYADDTIPGLRHPRPDEIADITFVIGDTPRWDPSAIRVTGTDWTAQVGVSVAPSRWMGRLPFGPVAAAATACADGLWTAVLKIAAATGRSPSAQFDYRVGRDATIDLSHFALGRDHIDLGDVDIISGGAITNAALFVVLLTPGVTGRIRVIEPDVLEDPNLNRYALIRRCHIGLPKTEVLAGYSTPELAIGWAKCRFDDSTVAPLEPIAPTVLVGADHIPTRWAAQLLNPRFLCVGATSHFFVTVSSHTPAGPCAGCAHARDEIGDEPIPTISFASLWAGLLQALHLLAQVTGNPSAGRYVHCYTLGLAGVHGMISGSLDPNPKCPVGCPAARATAA